MNSKFYITFYLRQKYLIVSILNFFTLITLINILIFAIKLSILTDHT